MSDLQIAKPYTLKCGLTLRNRLIKAAMAEGLAAGQMLPSEKLERVYEGWADGQWGMVLTGNVQVNAYHLGQPTDVAYDPEVDEVKRVESWKAWAKACTAKDTAAVVQINHPGRQSPLGAGKRSYFSKTLAPSPVPLQLGQNILSRAIVSLLFGTPKEMTVDDIQAVIKDFASTAKLAADSGFSGVQIHAAHGYLLAQFMSEKINQRTDSYGGTPEGRAKIIVEIVHAIRAVVPKKFCVGIKFNSTDHQSPKELQDCIKQLQAISAAGADFLEVSGGTYENPTMNKGVPEAKKSDRTKAREAFFIEFAKAIRKDLPDVPLMVTGGFRSRKGMEAAVADNGCDFIGIGRPAALQPELPKNVILNAQVSDDDAVLEARTVEAPWLLKQVGIKGLGAGIETKWYEGQLHKIHRSSVQAKA